MAKVISKDGLSKHIGEVLWWDQKIDGILRPITPVALDDILADVDGLKLWYSDGWDPTEDYGKEFWLWEGRPTEHEREAWWRKAETRKERDI